MLTKLSDPSLLIRYLLYLADMAGQMRGQEWISEEDIYRLNRELEVLIDRLRTNQTRPDLAAALEGCRLKTNVPEEHRARKGLRFLLFAMLINRGGLAAALGDEPRSQEVLREMVKFFRQDMVRLLAEEESKIDQPSAGSSSRNDGHRAST